MNNIQSFEEILKGRQEQLTADFCREELVSDWNENLQWYMGHFGAHHTPEKRQLLGTFIGLETDLFNLLQPCLGGAPLPEIDQELLAKLLAIRTEAIILLAEIGLLYERFVNPPAATPSEVVAEIEAFKQGTSFRAITGLTAAIPVLREMDKINMKVFA